MMMTTPFYSGFPCLAAAGGFQQIVQIFRFFPVWPLLGSIRFFIFFPAWPLLGSIRFFRFSYFSLSGRCWVPLDFSDFSLPGRCWVPSDFSDFHIFPCLAAAGFHQISSAFEPQGLLSADHKMVYADPIRLSKVSAPSLFLVGDRDRMCPPEGCRKTWQVGGPPHTLHQTACMLCVVAQGEV
jgi:pimeloyl-ACP methyl ester carboxylesterase